MEYSNVYAAYPLILQPKSQELMAVFASKVADIMNRCNDKGMGVVNIPSSYHLTLDYVGTIGEKAMKQYIQDLRLFKSSRSNSGPIELDGIGHMKSNVTDCDIIYLEPTIPIIFPSGIKKVAHVTLLDIKADQSFLLWLWLAAIQDIMHERSILGEEDKVFTPIALDSTIQVFGKRPGAVKKELITEI